MSRWVFVVRGVRARAARAVYFAVALAGTLAVAPAAQASFPGRNGLIAYQHQYVTPTNSIGTTAPSPDGYAYILTGGVQEPRNISWSPDGKRLAFDGPSTSLGSGHALYIINADGTGLRQVGRGDLRRYNPAWSPDGTKLAFVQDNGSGAGSGDIYTITTAGASLTRLTTSGSWDGSPDWSPDGTRIAYVCWSGGRPQVCQMTPSGGTKSVTTRALSLPGGVAQLSWSPGSANIAFSVRISSLAGYLNAGGCCRIYRMSRSGGSLRLLVAPDSGGYLVPNSSVAWSPDGTRIAFAFDRSDEGDVWTMNATNGTDQRVVQGNDSYFYADAGAWQPLR
jgi:Tol biopolymer transport system component